MNDDGFTLLEVIVAMAIMALAFLTLIDLFSKSVRSVEMTDQYMKAMTLANHKISELELLDFESEEIEGTFEQEENYRWNLTIEPYETTLNVDDENIRVVKVNLKVKWNEDKNEKEIELTTLKTLGETFPLSDKLIQAETASSGGGGSKSQSSLSSSSSSSSSSTSSSGGESNISGSVTGGSGANVSGTSTGSENISGAS